LYLAIGQFSLQYFDDIFFLGQFDFFSQVYDFLLDVDKSTHISSDFVNPQRIEIDDFSTDSFDFDIGFIGNLVNEISNGKFRTL